MSQFNEADRDQYGGDISAIRSAIDKSGVERVVRRDTVDRPGLLDIYRGDYIYIKEPTISTAHKWIELSENDASMTEYITSVSDGWKFCLAGEWDVRESLQHYVKANTAKQLTIAGKDNQTMALMWTPTENFDRLQKRERSFSDEVQYAVERQIAEAQSKAGRPREEGPYRVLDSQIKMEDDVEAARR